MRLSGCPGSPKTLRGSCKSFRIIVYSIQLIFNCSAPAIESLTLRQLDASCHRYILSPALLRAKRYADALSLSQDWFDPQYRAHWDYYHPPRGGCAFHPPSPEPMTQEHMEGYALPGLPATILLLNAAYATFRLWGDIELARQYLRMGARANPRIFVKILAGREKPSASPSHTSQVVSRVTNRSTLLFRWAVLTSDWERRRGRSPRVPLALAGLLDGAGCVGLAQSKSGRTGRRGEDVRAHRVRCPRSPSSRLQAMCALQDGFLLQPRVPEGRLAVAQAGWVSLSAVAHWLMAYSTLRIQIAGRNHEAQPPPETSSIRWTMMSSCVLLASPFRLLGAANLCATDMACPSL